VKDFTPISAAGRSRGYVVVGTGVPVANFRELIDYAKKNPGKLSYGTPNVASSFHLSGVLLEDAAGVKWVHVPYKGGAAAMRAVATGEIPMSIGSNGSGIPVLQSGKARLLAVLDADRDPKFPDVPTVAELYPGFERTADWTGIYGPAGLPRAVVQRLNAEIVATLKAPDTAEKLGNVGLVPSPTTPEEFAAMVARSIEVHRKAVKAAGVTPE
jgi:tripartite-type tricarboxylate transporter receptor subunit TctC